MCDISFDEMNDNWDEIKGDSKLNLIDLKNNKKFESIEYTATIQCCGNRGDYLYNLAKLKGPQPMNGFISTAKWKGVLISDILKSCGFDQKNNKFNEYNYVTFYGNDTDLTTLHYAISVPIEYIMNNKNDCIIAYEMNNKPLPRDHGYPMRVVIPG